MNPANDNKLNDTARFCAACGSADVLAATLSGGEASCNVCGWKGRVEDLAAFHFSHDMGSPEEVFRNFFLDIRKLLSLQFAKDIGALLIKWGFLDTPDAKNMLVVRKHLARYIAGCAKAIAESIAKTRADIEKETHSERTSS